MPPKSSKSAKSKGKGKATEPVDDTVSNATGPKDKAVKVNVKTLATRYDPWNWPQEAIDILKPLLNSPQRLTAAQVESVLKELRADWKGRQTPAFWQEFDKMPGIKGGKNRQMAHNKPSLVESKLRNYVVRELAAICGIGPSGYQTSLPKAVSWIQDMSVNRPYLIRKRFSAQFGIDQAVYAANNDDSDGLPDRSAALVWLKASKAAMTRDVIVKEENGGSGDSGRNLDPKNWPLAAIRAIKPLLEATGEWDEDLARRCVGDFQQFWYQLQTPGFRSDLRLVGHVKRAQLLWQRPMQALEQVIGHAGTGTGSRPASFTGIIRWLKRVYDDPSRELILSQFRRQFNVDITHGPTLLPSSAASTIPLVPVAPLQYSQIPVDRNEIDEAPDAADQDEIVSEAMNELDQSTGPFDPEATLDALQLLAWKKAKLKAVAEGVAAKMPHVPANNCQWCPRLFRSAPLDDRVLILEVLRTRLFKTAYNNERSFSTDRTGIIEALNEFVARVLEPKSTEQLRLIQLFPDLMITPHLLQLAGLNQGPATDQTSVIYAKFLVGGEHTMTTLAASPRPSSRSFASTLRKFLSSPLPAHLVSMDKEISTPDLKSLHFCHVGRFVNGAQNRRAWEIDEVRRYDASKGGRVWGECLVTCNASAKDMEYIVLADHSDRIGGEWCRRMTFDEIFFATLCLNPFLTNLAWPGLALPDPPSFIGEPLASGTSTASWIGRRGLVKAGSKWGCAMDGATLVCLQWLGWTGKDHPVDFIYDNALAQDKPLPKYGVVRYAVVNAIGDIFPVKWERNTNSKGQKRLDITVRLYVATPPSSRSFLQVRCAGTVKGDQTMDFAPEKRKVYSAMDPGSRAQRSIFYESDCRTGRINVKLAFHPTYTTESGRPAMSLTTEDGMFIRNGTMSNIPGCSLIIKITDEAYRMLLGERLPSQDSTDLSLWPETVRRRLENIAKPARDDQPEEEPAPMDLDEPATTDNVAGPSRATLLPLTESLIAEWAQLLETDAENMLEIRRVVTVDPDEEISLETLDLTNRGFNAAKDRLLATLEEIKRFCQEYKQRYDLSSLERIEEYDLAG